MKNPIDRRQRPHDDFKARCRLPICFSTVSRFVSCVLRTIAADHPRLKSLRFLSAALVRLVRNVKIMRPSIRLHGDGFSAADVYSRWQLKANSGCTMWPLALLASCRVNYQSGCAEQFGDLATGHVCCCNLAAGNEIGVRKNKNSSRRRQAAGGNRLPYKTLRL